MEIILASKSPRRKKILEKCGIKNFKIEFCEDKEIFNIKKDIEVSIEEVAKHKVDSVAKKFDKTEDICVIGGDTIVYLDNKIIGKPQNRQDAFNILNKLSSREHIVLSGLCVLIRRNQKTKYYTRHCESLVKFRQISIEEIEKYLNNASYMDKAGAYSIQNKEYNFVENIKGSYYNVVGLPIEILQEILEKENIK